jgi:ATP-binding cassette subfamily B protein
MEVIKIFGQTDSSFEKYENSVKNYVKYSVDWTLSSCKEMAIVTIVLPCTVILSLPIGLLMYFNGTLPLETLFFTLMITIGIGLPFNKALLFIPHFPQLSYAMNELEAVFFQEELKTGSITEQPKSYDIEFEKVSFAYEEKNVINDVSFRIKEKTMTAIVGPSGGGKSTLVKLLVHYYDIGSGKIIIGRESISDYSQEALTQMISFVSQDNFLFDDTIMENIRKGKQNATDEEIIKAAKIASAHDFIINLENGYHTVVGSSGGKLSGGERQRIAIARAMLKDAPIIVLDEATAYSDAENEDLIQDAINRLMKEKTVIVIAHRLRSIVNADDILVIDKGKIIDMGTHENLMKRSALYEHLWEANEKSYNWELGV